MKLYITNIDLIKITRNNILTNTINKNIFYENVILFFNGESKYYMLRLDITQGILTFFHKLRKKRKC